MSSSQPTLPGDTGKKDGNRKPYGGWWSIQVRVSFSLHKENHTYLVQQGFSCNAQGDPPEWSWDRRLVTSAVRRLLSPLDDGTEEPWPLRDPFIGAGQKVCYSRIIKIAHITKYSDFVDVIAIHYAHVRPFALP